MRPPGNATGGVVGAVRFASAVAVSDARSYLKPGFGADVVIALLTLK
jgi:hypothetical protein